eukprot:jgi/Ulvmu1/7841/UM004_0071.1
MASARSTAFLFSTGLHVLLLAIIIAHVVVTPYSKVEESFGIQAVHDFLYHGTDLNSYDHHEFPGVVPRSFVGPALLALASAPAAQPLRFLRIPKVYAIYIVRSTLGIFSWLCLCRLAFAVRRTFGSPTQAAFLLLSCLQFHVPYYASRTLPNVFAFGPVVLACAHWLDGSELWLAPAALTAVTIITRCDMLLLVACVSLTLLATRRMPLLPLLAVGICSAAAALAATVAFDSALWGRMLWPEGEVLWFNTILNKSKEWGVMPWHWYWSSALPRSLLASMPLAVVGAALQAKVRPYAAAITAFIALYSWLGHKETRFVLPVLPMCTVVAACGLRRLWSTQATGGVFALARLASIGALLLSAAAVVVFTQASIHNYPGGHALAWLHENADKLLAVQDSSVPGSCAPVRVHMDTPACMTGVTRFGQVMPHWQYSKTESMKMKQIQAEEFDFLISAAHEVPGYTMVHAVLGFDRVSLRPRSEWLRTLWPIQVNTSPKIFIHRWAAQTAAA